MRVSQFKNLLAELPRLSPEQLTNLRAAADRLHQHTHALSSMDAAIAGAGCPHCNRFKRVKNGLGRGTQRYHCKDCSRTFNAATNTPLSHLHSMESLADTLRECSLRERSRRRVTTFVQT